MRPHISINVSNVKNTVDFYKKVFGVNPQKQTEDYAKFNLESPSLNFSMQTAKNGRVPSQVNHFGIEVESVDGVNEWKNKLEKLKVEILTEEGVDCCYALQDKIWFQDPDGNSWEVFYVHEQLPIEGAQPLKKAPVCNTKSGCC